MNSNVACRRSFAAAAGTRSLASFRPTARPNETNRLGLIGCILHGRTLITPFFSKMPGDFAEQKMAMGALRLGVKRLTVPLLQLADAHRGELANMVSNGFLHASTS